jgi:tRNA/tmRNA/rRNA uracil-C5-methylase (TrmA/RlmC/RlmD family)
MDMAHVRKGDHVVDLYSGVGLFTLPLARRVGNLGRVVSLESSKNSVADARRNLAGLDHARVVDVAVNPRTAAQAVEPGSVVVLDPPRAGAGVDVMKAIAKAEPRRIVYVSCDAATLARDVAAAAESGWKLTKMRTLDLFPMTEHSEVVVCLDKRP